MVVQGFEPRASEELGKYSAPAHLPVMEKSLDEEEGIMGEQANFINIFQKAMAINSSTIWGFPGATGRLLAQNGVKLLLRNLLRASFLE